MSAPGRLYCPAASPLRPFVDGLAWLWRLGPAVDHPHPQAVGFGAPAEAVRLAGLVAERRLAGAVVLAPGAAPAPGPVPRRRIEAGVARFEDLAIIGQHTIFDGGAAVVRSSLGAHAVRDDDLLIVGAGPQDWGALQMAWILDAIARFLVERLQRPLVLLPQIGCLRLDDFPGTAELQLRRAARRDARQRRRARRLVATLRRAGARLVLALPARALRGRVEVSLDRVWPRATKMLAAGIEAGVFEVACHGLSHLDDGALAEGRIDPREFSRLDRVESGRRLDAAADWLRVHVGPPRSFVAPAWGYSAGALAAAAERGLPVWLPPEPRPLLRVLELRETLRIGLPGLHGLDYSPVERLASLGVPPIVVFHGQLLDDRLPRLRARRDLISAARLLRARDLPRIARLAGVRWVGAAELVEELRSHATIGCDADASRARGGGARLFNERGP